MKISELIKRLENIKEEHGDLPVYITHEWSEELDQEDEWGGGVRYCPAQNSGWGVFPDRVNIS